MKKASKGDLNKLNISINNVLSSGLTDLLGLASGAKKASYLMYKEETIKKVFSSLDYLAPEKDFKIVYAPERKWINNLNGNKKQKHFFIGEDKDRLLKLRDAFDKKIQNVSHQEIGILLSYPSCCANRKNYSINLKKDYSQTSANEINFLMNNFFIKSNSNLFLYSFYPCSYYCKEANNYVEKIFEWLKNFPDTRNFIEEKLKMPIMYFFPSTHPKGGTSVGMVFSFNGEYKDKNTILYSEIYSSTKAVDNTFDVTEGKDILNKVLDGNRIKIRQNGFDVYKDSTLMHKIDNEKIVFFWPK